MRWAALLVGMAVLFTACQEENGGERAPARIERELPIGLYLANLCPGTATPARIVRRLRREAEVLLREAREHPDWLVEYTSHDAHGGDQREMITIRQLAQEHLQSIEDHPGPCEPKLRRQLEVVADSRT